MYGFDGMVTMPSGSRRAMTAPVAAVSVSRVPGLPAQCVDHGPIGGDPSRGVHPAEPVQHVVRDGRECRRGSDRQAAAYGRPAGLPAAWPRGTMSGVVMAASPQGGAGPRVRVMPGLGEISPVWVSEAGLEPIAHTGFMTLSRSFMLGSAR